ncbi:hypothetical protein ES703_41661 [subsurface metagenome]
MELRYIFASAILAGVFTGIYVETGQNVDPESLVIEVGDTVAKAVGGSQWSFLRPILILAGLVSIVAGIFRILLSGLPGIISATGGYFGGLLVVTSVAPVV